MHSIDHTFANSRAIQ